MTLTSDYSILDHLLEGCQIIGFDWRYIYVNDAAMRQGKQTKEALLGRTMMEMYPGIETTEMFAALQHCMKQRVPQRKENQFIYPDGSKGWFELYIQPMPEGIFIFSQDISERKQANLKLEEQNKELLFQNEEKEKRAAELVLANKELLFQEEELRESEERFYSAFEYAAIGMAMIALDGHWLKVNRALCDIVGYSEKELRTKTFQDITHPDDLETDLMYVRQMLAGEIHTYQMEKRYFHKLGQVVWILLSVSLVHDGEGKPLHFISQIQDITERKRVELETFRRLQNIQALQKIDQAIAGSLDLNLTLNVVLEQVKTQLNIDAAAILLLNPHTQILEFSSGLGFRSKAIERSRLRLGEGHSGRAALERRTVSVTNLLENSTQFVRAPLLADEGFATYFGTPLIAKGQVNGVLEIYHRLPFAPDENWLELFKILAGQAAIAVDSASLFTNLIHSNAELFAAYDSTIEGWSHALDLRDKETEGHTQRVTEMTMKLTHAAGMTEAELVHVRRGALLHDIGKMGVPDHILLKPGRLTDEEWVA